MSASDRRDVAPPREHPDQPPAAPWANAADAPLGARGLSVGYRQRRRPDVVVLGPHDLALRRGALTVLLGPNGSGKTTLLRTLAGMQDPLAGTVTVEEEPLARLEARERARRMAVVLTDPVDVGLLRAVDLVALGRHPHTRWDGRLAERDHHVVAWALEAVGAQDLAQRRVTELSDGERQRVLIARALAQEPAVLLLDEPVAYVDVARRVELLGLLRDLAHECDLSVLVSTHDVDLALRGADHAWLLVPTADPARGQGHGRATLRDGAPEDLALQGAVSAAFGTEATAFDVATGTFRSARTPLASVRLAGDGPPARWTARALEREGLRVAEAGEPAAATITVREDPVRRWRLDAHEWSSDHASLGSMTTTLRRLLPHLASAPSRADAGVRHGLAADEPEP